MSSKKRNHSLPQFKQAGNISHENRPLDLSIQVLIPQPLYSIEKMPASLFLTLIVPLFTKTILNNTIITIIVPKMANPAQHCKIPYRKQRRVGFLKRRSCKCDYTPSCIKQKHNQNGCPIWKKEGKRARKGEKIFNLSHSVLSDTEFNLLKKGFHPPVHLTYLSYSLI